MRRIGIYGGSFNPVHYGHLNVVRHALDELALDKLLVVPAAQNPFKAEHVPPEFPHRLDLLKAAFDDFDPRVSVDLREVNRGGVSYAIDTIRELSSEFIGAQLFYIIGEDNVGDLPKWKDSDELQRLCTFKSFPRTKESSTEIRNLFDAAHVVENSDAKLVEVVRKGLVAKGGFCPCRLPKVGEFFCPCDEFKAQLADPSFHGLCHCRLYLKP